MDREAFTRRVRYIILAQLEAGDRLSRDAVVRAASLADQVLATAAGVSAADCLRDGLSRLALARAEWVKSADDPEGFGAGALDEIARELSALLDEL